MKTEDLKQSPFNTTLLGILRGVADHFAIGASDAALFGGSGHAFVINIHEQLCPSGPYCWNGGHFDRLIRNLGIERTDTGFDTAQPWYPHNKDFPPKRLSSGSWTEFGDECHVNFFSYGQIEPASRPETILASLEYAVDLWENPSRHTGRGYGMGPDGYARFIDAVKAGAGDSHGNWWNATVWSECRAMAATYFDEIADDFPAAST
ncbi:MAG: hypothetical protein HOE86_01090, partial [Gemmatimonadetes bacterium]|nr:hypothetical protein [Gemmatimonadota bacterium]